MSDYAIGLAWAVVAIAFFSYLAVNSWANNRRQEREAYYRSEAIKKVAEMQGQAPESVIAMLREALETPAPPPHPNPMVIFPQYRKEREAFYRNETLRKIAGMTAPAADAVIQYLREDEKKSSRRVMAGLRLSGMILTAIGIAMTIFLHQFMPGQPNFYIGLLPALIGVALLGFSFLGSEHAPR